ncbi:MAG TPA: MBOAT family O-acyltransferase [Bacillota bacterium]|jgi:alginate O-acetyltransferase complex protein AlgI|nr:MBOAT family O-acyltransferase [Bacillota bacterium]HOL08823.1 MBOAT family O-acyltransferase [Bacillota bacterium]HPO98763.1 MBOAT family O-acyltransferase [Bacillota bacterium]
MLFNSLEFLIFFPLVIALYFILPHKFRWALLLLASCIFYMYYKPIYIVLLMFSAYLDYCVSIKMEETSSKQKKKFYLLVSLIGNLGLLFIFKYFNFFNSLFGAAVTAFGGEYSFRGLNLLLPMGISFYTFQTLSYTIDVYRGNRKAERHFGYFALYVSYFPQLVAGPIERSDRLLPQLQEQHNFDYDRAVSGLRRMLWGFFKKVIIADNLAVVVNPVFANPYKYNGFTLLLGVLFFNIQIFCDFSAYSDIAIGSARVMGVELMENFRRPYFARNLNEFWRRWHISLTTWFKDYLYFPLGGSRVSRARRNLNVSLVFLISGLWHGANLTFIVWGAFHALLQFFGEITKSFREQIYTLLRIPEQSKFKRVFQILITFTIVCLAGLIFRAQTLSDAYYIATHLIDFDSNYNLRVALENLGLNSMQVLLIFLTLFAIGIMFLKHLLEELNVGRLIDINRYPIALRWGLYLFLLFFIVIAGSFTNQEFIYFQF